MAYGEFNPREAWIASNARLEKVAGEAGRQATEAATEFLKGCEDIVQKDLIDQIILRKSQMAAAAKRRVLMQGGENVNSNKEPGITAFFVPDGLIRLRNVASEYDGRPETEPLKKYLAEMQPVDDQVTAYALRLPEGAYFMGMGGCQFYGVAPGWGSVQGRVAHDPFKSKYDDVLRIDSDSGEFWHNTAYDLDGTRRENRF